MAAGADGGGRMAVSCLHRKPTVPISRSMEPYRDGRECRSRCAAVGDADTAREVLLPPGERSGGRRSCPKMQRHPRHGRSSIAIPIEAIALLCVPAWADQYRDAIDSFKKQSRDGGTGRRG